MTKFYTTQTPPFWQGFRPHIFEPEINKRNIDKLLIGFFNLKIHFIPLYSTRNVYEYDEQDNIF